MRSKWTIGLATTVLVGVMAIPAGAWQLEPGDRGLLHAYSPDAFELLWGTVQASDETVCEIEDGEQYTYRNEEDQITVLDDEGQVLTDDCSLTATNVEGPEGQVNHGTVVSSFVHALKEAGYERIGCYVSVIARTDYGKGDQQVRAGEVTDTTNGAPSETPTVDFTVTATKCNEEASTDAETENEAKNGPPAWVKERKAERESASSPQGKPEWAGPPAHAGKPENSGPPPHARGNGKSQ